MCMSPVVKWAGGKRQILEKLKANMPANFNNYFEPFIGGGALLFDLAPVNATINDFNKVNCFNFIKKYCTKINKTLTKKIIIKNPSAFN